jgi:hypothetical protein
MESEFRQCLAVESMPSQDLLCARLLAVACCRGVIQLLVLSALEACTRTSANANTFIIPIVFMLASDNVSWDVIFGSFLNMAHGKLLL